MSDMENQKKGMDVNVDMRRNSGDVRLRRNSMKVKENL